MSARKTDFRQRIAAGIADDRVIQAVHEATLHKVDASTEALAELSNREGLRDLAARIKQHSLDNLPRYLDQFAAACERNGTRVHFAANAQVAREIICEIARGSGSKLAVKSKSMATEEIRLNDALEAAGVRTVETDLGEFIVQIDHDRPSHIVTPIIHKDRRQIAQALAREIGCEYTEDPEELTKIARTHLRDIFRRCDLGITGANFAIAESGTICICTNEGNGRMTTTRPRVHIALVGIEKLVPRVRDLPIFLKLLARSSTGQPLTVYTTLVTGPKRPGDRDGPDEVHVVLLDNGRADILDGLFREVLRCIRCGGCLNACPVFRNIGGHAYGDVYPGPIGSLVTPLLSGIDEYAELPRASSLCGACQVACPVKIDLPGLLVKLRVETRARQSLGKRLGMSLWKWLMQSPALFGWGQLAMRRILRGGDDGWTRRGLGPVGEWTKVRDLPPPPKRSFRECWRKGLGDEG
ncbi:MAG: iron-sulfur cluster-binding protein [Planctomycetes bacterium]|nr:iron-sulfur cluster-binding protein [Planctomycetota bacterium]